MTELPLGITTSYPERYAPETLCRIERAGNRERIGLGADLPFSGVDIWNAWDLTWLDPDGHPRVGTAEFRVPADSPNLVESKSLKLYLWSFRDEGAFHEAVTNRILQDLVQATAPRFMRLTARFNVRGGIYTTVVAEHRAPGWTPPAAVTLP